MKNSRIKNGIMRIVQGIIIGAGAILPGISGGVLAVVFGIYRPAMELLTHPRRALQRVINCFNLKYHHCNSCKWDWEIHPEF